MRTMSLRHALWLAVSLSIATDAPILADDLQTKRTELGQWVMNYYLHPDPENFVERVKGMSTVGLLYDASPNARSDANVMFLGKIMAANPGKIQEWLNALATMTNEEKIVLNRAAWYSGTAEGNAWLVEHGEAALANGPRPMFLRDKQAVSMEPRHLDELWEWFFATGDQKPIGRIVSLFSLAHELPRQASFDLLPPPVKLDAAASPKDERLYKLRTSNYRLLKPALWSCTSMAIQHDRVLEILKEVERTHYHASIKAWLGQIIKIAEAERAKKKKD